MGIFPEIYRPDIFRPKIFLESENTSSVLNRCRLESPCFDPHGPELQVLGIQIYIQYIYILLIGLQHIDGIILHLVYIYIYIYIASGIYIYVYITGWWLSRAYVYVYCIYIYTYPCTTWIIHVYITGWWLSRPSEKWWSSSVGMMKFQTEWKNNKCSKPPTKLLCVFMSICRYKITYRVIIWCIPRMIGI